MQRCPYLAEMKERFWRSNNNGNENKRLTDDEGDDLLKSVAMTTKSKQSTIARLAQPEPDEPDESIPMLTPSATTSPPASMPPPPPQSVTTVVKASGSYIRTFKNHSFVCKCVEKFQTYFSSSPTDHISYVSGIYYYKMFLRCRAYFCTWSQKALHDTLS